MKIRVNIEDMKPNIKKNRRPTTSPVREEAPAPESGSLMETILSVAGAEGVSPEQEAEPISTEGIEDLGHDAAEELVDAVEKDTGRDDEGWETVHGADDAVDTEVQERVESTEHLISDVAAASAQVEGFAVAVEEPVVVYSKSEPAPVAMPSDVDIVAWAEKYGINVRFTRDAFMEAFNWNESHRVLVVADEDHGDPLPDAADDESDSQTPVAVVEDDESDSRGGEELDLTVPDSETGLLVGDADPELTAEVFGPKQASIWAEKQGLLFLHIRAIDPITHQPLRNGGLSVCYRPPARPSNMIPEVAISWCHPDQNFDRGLGRVAAAEAFLNREVTSIRVPEKGKYTQGLMHVLGAATQLGYGL